MTKIVCRAIDCIFWEDGICSSDEIVYDPEEGCLTYEGIEDVLDDDDWEDDDDDDDLWDDDDDIVDDSASLGFSEFDDPFDDEESDIYHNPNKKPNQLD